MPNPEGPSEDALEIMPGAKPEGGNSPRTAQARPRRAPAALPTVDFGPRELKTQIVAPPKAVQASGATPAVDSEDDPTNPPAVEWVKVGSAVQAVQPPLASPVGPPRNPRRPVPAAAPEVPVSPTVLQARIPTSPGTKAPAPRPPVAVPAPAPRQSAAVPAPSRAAAPSGDKSKDPFAGILDEHDLDELLNPPKAPSRGGDVGPTRAMPVDPLRPARPPKIGGVGRQTRGPGEPEGTPAAATSSASSDRLNDPFFDDNSSAGRTAPPSASTSRSAASEARSRRNDAPGEDEDDDDYQDTYVAVARRKERTRRRMGAALAVLAVAAAAGVSLDRGCNDARLTQAVWPKAPEGQPDEASNSGKPKGGEKKKGEKGAGAAAAPTAVPAENPDCVFEVDPNNLSEEARNMPQWVVASGILGKNPDLDRTHFWLSGSEGYSYGFSNLEGATLAGKGKLVFESATGAFIDRDSTGSPTGVERIRFNGLTLAFDPKNLEPQEARVTECPQAE